MSHDSHKQAKSALSYSLPPENLLIVGVAGPNQGEQLLLHKAKTTFGRTDSSDISISGGLVSRDHAVILYENNRYLLYDQNSTNGTWVNGQRISHHILQPHDRIQVGPSIFVVKFVADGRITPTAPSPPPPATPTPQGFKSTTHSSGLYSRSLDDYELFEQWVGGMAVVHKAKSRHSGRIVAVKLLKSQDPYVKDKFIKEIEVGKTLNHPHIVQVLGGGQHEGRWYMVMEFMDNKTLADRIVGGRPMTPEFTLAVIGQMCDALAYAHQRGVYHRDIKPANILFNQDNVAKLGDFGIARLAQAVTMTVQGAILGTPRYMSYEQATGQKVDHRSDLYSLGVVLYQLLTGSPPFTAKDALHLIDCHINRQPPPLDTLNPNVSPQLAQVALKAMAKNPDERFQSADEMADALGHSTHRRKTSTYMAALTLCLETEYHEIIELRRGTTILGREKTNPHDTEISRRHARITYQSGRWWLEDLQSTNGTWLNEKRIFDRVMVQPEDVLRLGATKLTVRLQ